MERVERAASGRVVLVSRKWGEPSLRHAINWQADAVPWLVAVAICAACFAATTWR